MAGIPFNFQTYKDRERITPDRFAFTAGDEMLNVIQESFQQGSLTGAATDFIGEKFAEQGTNVISADEANEKYSIPNELSFDSEISEGAAKRRFKQHQDYLFNQRVHDLADNNNDWFANTRNTILSLGTMVASDAYMFMFPPLKAFQSVARSTRAMQLATKSAFAGKALKGLENIAFNPNLYGKGLASEIGTAVTRGVINDGIYQGLTEAALFNQAERNGYDYNALLGIASVALGGAISGGVEFATFVRPTTKTLQGIDNLFDVDNYVKSKAISREAFESLTARVISDVNAGAITDLNVIRAVATLDSNFNLADFFRKKIQKGEISTLINKNSIKGLSNAELAKLKPSLNFARALKKEGIFENVLHIDDLEVPQNFKSLDYQKFTEQKIDNLLKETQQNIKQAKTTQQVAKLEEEQRFLKAMLNQKRFQKIDKAFQEADNLGYGINKTNPGEMTFDEYKEAYAKVSKSLQKKRVNASNFKRFFQKNKKTQAELVNLYRLFDVDDINFNLNDILRLSDEDLARAHAKHVFKNESINAMSEQQAREIVAKYSKNPEETQYLDFAKAEEAGKLQKEQAKANMQDVNELQQTVKQKVDNAAINEEIEEGLSKDPVGDKFKIPEEIRQLDEYKEADSFWTGTRKYISGLIESTNCLLR